MTHSPRSQSPPQVTESPPDTEPPPESHPPGHRVPPGASSCTGAGGLGEEIFKVKDIRSGAGTRLPWGGPRPCCRGCSSHCLKSGQGLLPRGLSWKAEWDLGVGSELRALSWVGGVRGGCNVVEVTATGGLEGV